MTRYNKGDTIEFAEWVEGTRMCIVLEGPIYGNVMLERYDFGRVPMIMYNRAKNYLEVFSMQSSDGTQFGMLEQVYYYILIGDSKGWLSGHIVKNLSQGTKKEDVEELYFV